MLDEEFDPSDSSKRRLERLKRAQEGKNQQRDFGDDREYRSSSKQHERQQKQTAKQIVRQLRTFAENLNLEEILMAQTESVSLPGYPPQVMSDRDNACVGIVTLCHSGSNDQRHLIGIWLQQRGKEAQLIVGDKQLDEDSDSNWALPPDRHLRHRVWSYHPQKQAQLSSEIEQALKEIVKRSKR